MEGQIITVPRLTSTGIFAKSTAALVENLLEAFDGHLVTLAAHVAEDPRRAVFAHQLFEIGGRHGDQHGVDPLGRAAAREPQRLGRLEHAIVKPQRRTKRLRRGCGL